MQHAPSLSRTVIGADCVVVMKGEFDLSWAGPLKGELDSVVSSCAPEHRILIDLSEVTFMDSTALGILVGAHKAAIAAGTTMAMFGAAAGVRRLLQITHIDELMPVYDDLTHAGQHQGSPGASASSEEPGA